MLELLVEMCVFNVLLKNNYVSMHNLAAMLILYMGLQRTLPMFKCWKSLDVIQRLLSQLISTGFLLATRYLGVLLVTRQQGILLATRQQGVLLATGADGGNQLQDRALPNDSPFQAICLPYVVNACKIHVAPHKAIAT